MTSKFVVAAEYVLVQAVLNEAAHEKVKQPIVVIIEPYSTRRPSGRSDACFFGRVGERPVAIVMIKNTLAVSRDKQVGVAVVVVIANSHAHAEGSARHARLVGHIGECAVMIISVESIPGHLARLIKIAEAIVDKINVHPTIVVIVQKCASGSKCLGKVSLI